MTSDTRLSDLAKECEYLEAKTKEIESIEVVKELIEINSYQVIFEDKQLNLHPIEAQELKEALLTIISHGIMRIKRELRGEL